MTFFFSKRTGGGGIGALSLSLIALGRGTVRASNERSGCGNTLALCTRLLALFCSDQGPHPREQTKKPKVFTFHLNKWRRGGDCRCARFALLTLALARQLQNRGRPARIRLGFALFCSDPGVLIPENKRKSQKFSLLTFHFPLK